MYHISNSFTKEFASGRIIFTWLLTDIGLNLGLTLNSFKELCFINIKYLNDILFSEGAY